MLGRGSPVGEMVGEEDDWKGGRSLTRINWRS